MQEEPQPKKQVVQRGPSNFNVIMFVITLSFFCALILSVLASALGKRQEIAKELDRSKQMLISAKILSHQGNFLIRNDKGETEPAKYAGDGRLIPGSMNDYATEEEILDVFSKRISPFLVNDKGEISNFSKTGINLKTYISDFKETGYYTRPWKLIYAILPNPETSGEHAAEEPIGYVIPINGQGLWNAIYGYLAIEPDGNTVIGISWYEQSETPGLGANIAEAPWQDLFPGKKIFQLSPSGEFDANTSPVGIVVVKGKVSEVLGDLPKAKSAVDGMAGATLTGNGVTQAYKDVLNAYRPFLTKLTEETKS